MIHKNPLGDTPVHSDADSRIIGINWNEIVDQKDLEIWNTLTKNFWLPEKIPVASDIPKWASMSDAEKDATLKVFTGLTLLDTMQGTIGAPTLMKWSLTPQEEANYTNMAFMESVHAKSYSNIFMTLATTDEINDAYKWSAYNENLQNKAHLIMGLYDNVDRADNQVASVLLESFLFYSGFYLPLRMSSEGKLTNSADIIRLIIRDEAVHGYYIGYKFQQWSKNEDPFVLEAQKERAVELLLELYFNELEYTRDIYDPLGWTKDVGAFLRYNANKAMNNLGFESIFPADECKFNPAVQVSLSPNSNENHDFFSGSGSSYVIGKTETTADDDWDF